MMCMSHYEIKPHVYKEFIEKNKCMRTYGMLENGLGGIHGWGTTFGCLTEKGLFR